MPSLLRRIVNRLMRDVTRPMCLVPSLRLLRRYLLIRSCGLLEPELHMLPHWCGRGEMALDVGANWGLYSYRLASSFTNVIALEPNKTLTDDLAAWSPSGVRILHVAASSKAGTATLHIPRAAHNQLDGWASLEKNHTPDVTEYDEVKVPTVRLDDLEVSRVDFIKIDVEGHELEVLDGCQRILSTFQPVMLVEVQPQSEARVHALMTAHGYTLRTLKELTGCEGSPVNRIYFPSDK